MFFSLKQQIIAYLHLRYITTVYLSFTNGIPSEAEHLFDLPDKWPAYCGNANTGKFSVLNDSSIALHVLLF
jgi:hypothetical protein